MTVINWDFLLKESDILLQAPVLFTIALSLGIISAGGGVYWLLEKIYRGQISSLEGRLKLRDDQSEINTKAAETLIANSNKKLEPQQKLTDIEIKFLEFVEAFELINPPQLNQVPPECSVDEAASKLEVEWGQTNETFRKLKRLNFAVSLWEGQATFPILDHSLNQEKPIRLTTEGRNYLKAYHRNSNLE